MCGLRYELCSSCYMQKALSEQLFRYFSFWQVKIARQYCVGKWTPLAFLHSSATGRLNLGGLWGHASNSEGGSPFVQQQREEVGCWIQTYQSEMTALCWLAIFSYTKQKYCRTYWLKTSCIITQRVSLHIHETRTLKLFFLYVFVAFMQTSVIQLNCLRH